VYLSCPPFGRQEQPTGAADSTQASTQQSSSVQNHPAGAPAGTGSYLGEILANYLRMFEYLSRQLSAGCSL